MLDVRGLCSLVATAHAKMGNHALAADFYRTALDFVIHPSRRDDYDDADFYREHVEKVERLPGLH